MSIARLLFIVHALLIMPVECAIHIFGDSHISSFVCIEDCQFHWVGPRTMHRFGRDRLECLDMRLHNIQKNDTVIFVFGEIDIRCHIGKQRDINNCSLEEVIQILVSNYVQAIEENRAVCEGVRFGVFAPIPPTDTIYSKEFPFYGTLEDRIAITRCLNKALHEICALKDIFVIDVYDVYAQSDGSLNTLLSDGNVHISGSHNDAIREALSRIIGRPLAVVPYVNYQNYCNRYTSQWCKKEQKDEYSF